MYAHLRIVGVGRHRSVQRRYGLRAKNMLSSAETQRLRTNVPKRVMSSNKEHPLCALPQPHCTLRQLLCYMWSVVQPRDILNRLRGMSAQSYDGKHHTCFLYTVTCRCRHLLIVIVLCMHGAQQAPGVHVLRLPLYLRFQRQHGLAQQPALEQRLALGKALCVLHESLAVNIWDVSTSIRLGFYGQRLALGKALCVLQPTTPQNVENFVMHTNTAGHQHPSKLSLCLAHLS